MVKDDRGDVAAFTPTAHAVASRLGAHLTSATTWRTRGAYHLTFSTCSTRTAQSIPAVAAISATSLSSLRAHASSSPLATFPWTCITPPVSGRSAATAVGHARSLSGNKPRRTRSATPRGAVLLLSPSSTSHRLSSISFATRFFFNAATLLGFHSHAYTFETPACFNNCKV
eukprot:31176-Pelagococcus_subviridis.AAC.11